MGAELSFKGSRTEFKSKRKAIYKERKEQLKSVGAELRENS